MVDIAYGPSTERNSKKVWHIRAKTKEQYEQKTEYNDILQFGVAHVCTTHTCVSLNWDWLSGWLCLRSIYCKKFHKRMAYQGLNQWRLWAIVRRYWRGSKDCVTDSPLLVVFRHKYRMQLGWIELAFSHMHSCLWWFQLMWKQ